MSSTSSLAPSPGPSTPLSPYLTPHHCVYTASPTAQAYAPPYIPPPPSPPSSPPSSLPPSPPPSPPLTPGVHLHSAIIAPNLQYDVRFLPTLFNPHLLPAILAQPTSAPPLPNLRLHVGDLPWLLDVTPDSGLSPGKAYVTVQDVLLAIHRHLRLAVRSAEYEAMSRSRKGEIFRQFERRVGSDPAQRARGLRRVDFLNGLFRAQGLVRAHSNDDVWEVVIHDQDQGGKPALTLIVSTG